MVSGNSGNSGKGGPRRGHSAVAASPSARQAPPVAQSQAVDTRLARRPNSGATTATVSGQGVRKSPVVKVFWPRLCCR